MFGLILFLHVLSATIWTGGHIVLAVVILPRVLRERSARRLLEFESVYEKIGMPAFLIQILTGLYLAKLMVPDMVNWLDFNNPVSRLIMLKLLLLLLTVTFAIDARIRVIPKLSENKLLDMSWHIIPVTLFSVLFVFVGVSFRTGLLY